MPPLPPPAPEFANNPLETREDLAKLCTKLCSALLPHASPRNALIRLGNTSTHYDEVAAQLEGYARPLWGLASVYAGDLREGQTKDGEVKQRMMETETLVSLWVSGLKAGTDPQSEEYWGEVRDKDQRMVEMCPIGYALAIGGEAIWNKLELEDQKRVEQWLGQVNDKEMPNTNWLWFRVFANLGLRMNSAPHSFERLSADIAHLDTFFIEGSSGWSRDGPPGIRQLDYYSGPFAIQISQLLYAKFAEKDDPERSRDFKQRAIGFAKDHVHYFDQEGRAVPFGRSCTYRFAMAAFWGAVAVAFEDAKKLEDEWGDGWSWGLVKGFLCRNLSWWMKQDAMWNADGTLSIGYTYPNMFFTENYNSPGSPYWCNLAFLPLGLPASHPFWTAQELDHPLVQPSISYSDAHSMPHPMHISCHQGQHTFLLSSGQLCSYPIRATQAKYGKFAYSSFFGFSVPTGSVGLDMAAPDSMIAFSEDDGETWKQRRVAEEPTILECGEGKERNPVLHSIWKPWRDVSIETWLIPPTEGTAQGDAWRSWHFRLHRVKSGRELLSAEGAWALHGQGEDGRHLDPFPSSVPSSSSYQYASRTIRTSKSSLGYHQAPNEALVVSKGASGIRELGEIIRDGEVLRLDAGANIVESRAVLPLLKKKWEASEETWLCVAVMGVTDAEGWEERQAEAWAADVKAPEWVAGMLVEKTLLTAMGGG